MKTGALSPALQKIADAAAALLEVVRQIQSGEAPPVSAANKIPNARIRLASPRPDAGPAGRPILLADAVNEFLLAKARAGRSDRYLRQAHVTLGAFARGREERPLASITAEEIELWLHSQKWRPRTKAGYLLDLRTCLNFALKRGHLAANPANAVDVPRYDPAPPGLHTPEQAAAVLRIAARDPDVRRSLAIRYFAGLRRSEASTIAEENLLEEFIEVPAANAKTRQRRLVTIQPNLRAWLALGGRLPLRQINNRIAAVVNQVRAAGILWPANAPRHSFCSYHLAHFQNAARTALEAGHSEAMLFRHYRALVTPAAARAFWEIRP